MLGAVYGGGGNVTSLYLVLRVLLTQAQVSKIPDAHNLQSGEHTVVVNTPKRLKSLWNVT